MRKLLAVTVLSLTLILSGCGGGSTDEDTGPEVDPKVITFGQDSFSIPGDWELKEMRDVQTAVIDVQKGGDLIMEVNYRVASPDVESVATLESGAMVYQEACETSDYNCFYIMSDDVKMRIDFTEGNEDAVSNDRLLQLVSTYTR